MQFDIKDSGKREEFDTGSVRDTEEGKGDYSLLSFIALRRLALHYQNGANKYAAHNWRKGQNVSRYFSSTIRHLIKWYMNWEDEDHLSAALFNICGIIETMEMIKRGKLDKSLDDRYEGTLDDMNYE